ncbi:cytochrome P450 [Plantactinospora sp. BC1]|uniref:cytochrome P450 n=1 Tax=Plantactinospora sp. BC1 TaxID=2108470 RepID=UPI000D15974C|nr:cytochrome P450 [Plantactinospora sp. BC1]AVT28438.1 cytochrome P450 [Plantactinospora sp. BC1]
MTRGAGTVDLTDVDVFVAGGHPAVFAHLRAHDPIHLNQGADGSRFWALTRYEDVLWAYSSHELFGSTRGAIVGGSFRSEEDTSAGKMLVSTDLPRHRMLKQIIHPAMSTSVAKRVAARVSVLLDDALARLRRNGGGDFATEVATELPAGALMEIMGLSHEEAHHLIGLTRRMVGYRDEVFVETGGDERLRLAWLQAEIFEFFTDVVAARRRDPGEDLITMLLHGTVNGRKLTEEEVFYNCMNVAVGGNETSSYTGCTGLLALLDHPDQYDLLLSRPAIGSTVVDEMLRWSSTNAYVQRVVLRDVERGGVTFRAGESVTLWNYSANRDERVFADGDRFDATRSPNRHLSYGAGLHRCVGAPVAQAELSLLVEKIAAQGLRLKLAGDVRRLRSNFILGVTSLPVEPV